MDTFHPDIQRAVAMEAQQQKEPTRSNHLVQDYRNRILSLVKHVDMDEEDRVKVGSGIHGEIEDDYLLEHLTLHEKMSLQQLLWMSTSEDL